MTETGADSPGINRKSWLKQSAPYVVLCAMIILLPFFVSAYIQSMVIKILVFGIFALSLNILWGYTGLFSLGHAAYFGVAGYTSGILLVNLGIKNFWITAPAGVLTAVVFAAILAVPALRMSGAYFLMVTLAMGELIFSVAEKWRSVTHGGDGLVGISLPNLHLGFTMNNLYFYYLVFIFFIVCGFLIYRIVNSPFGDALQGIRENEPRMRSLGYNTWLYKYMAFVVGGLFAGVAGVLFGHFTGIMAPGHIGIMTSTLVMLMVILGGSSVIFGPVLGAAIVLILEHVASIYAPERWPLILGAVFVMAVMFLRGGISLHLLKLWRKLGRGSTPG